MSLAPGDTISVPSESSESSTDGSRTLQSLFTNQTDRTLIEHFDDLWETTECPEGEVPVVQGGDTDLVFTCCSFCRSGTCAVIGSHAGRVLVPRAALLDQSSFSSFRNVPSPSPEHVIQHPLDLTQPNDCLYVAAILEHLAPLLLNVLLHNMTSEDPQLP